MKLLTLVACFTLVTAFQIDKKDPPCNNNVCKVVTLMEGMRTTADTDHQKMQEECDKGGCECVDSLSSLTHDIRNSKEKIKETSDRIEELKTEVASQTAELAQYKADHAANADAQKKAVDAYDLRSKEIADEQANNDLALRALDNAIKTLRNWDGAGFLQNGNSNDVTAAASSLRDALATTSLSIKASAAQLNEVQYFVAHPEEFAGRSSAALMQNSNNPFGDYSQRSTKIVGVMEGLKEAIQSDVDKLTDENTKLEKSHTEFLRVNAQERTGLENAIESTSEELDRDKQDEIVNKETRKTHQASLKANTEAKETQTLSCQSSRQSCNEEGRLRITEISGFDEAIKILKDNADIFRKSLEKGSPSPALIQLSADSDVATRLKQIALESGNERLMSLVRGHGDAFAHVLVEIDKMIAKLRADQKEDIAHRDQCNRNEQDNANTAEDIAHHKNKLENEKQRLENTRQEKQDAISATELDIKDLKEKMDEARSQFDDETHLHRAAQGDDENAIEVIGQARAALAKFYENEDGNYGGRKSENTGIDAILQMIIEDIQKQMGTRTKDFKAKEGYYNQLRSEHNDQMNAYEATKTELSGALAEANMGLAANDEDQENNNDAKHNEENRKQNLANDCRWVTSHFDSRKVQRESELQGLQEAKAYLAQVSK